jgi:hypothetical protein
MTPEDMLVAIISNGGIKSVVASVVSVDQTEARIQRVLNWTLLKYVTKEPLHVLKPNMTEIDHIRSS